MYVGIEKENNSSSKNNLFPIMLFCNELKLSKRNNFITLVFFETLNDIC